MKRIIAIILTVISILACLTVFAGCTAEARLQAKQALCSHKWKETRVEKGDCKHNYDTITYNCSRCNKSKKEKVSANYEHDFQVIRTERGIDCQHQDYELIECTACKLQFSNSFDTYGSHKDYDGDGKCNLCGKSIYE